MVKEKHSDHLSENRNIRKPLPDLTEFREKLGVKSDRPAAETIREMRDEEG